MKKASIDIGSNSVLLSICEVEGDQLQEIYSGSNVTSLGRDLDLTKKLNVMARTETLAVLTEYKKIIEDHQITSSHVIITGTEVLRAALDAEEFMKEIDHLMEVPVTLLSGEGEAFYTAMGVSKSSAIKGDDVLIMDMGGASTELIHFNKDHCKILSSVSLPVGAARSTQWLEDDSFDKKISEITNKFPLGKYQAESIVCVAGSMTTLAAMVCGLDKFDSLKLEGATLEISKFKRFCASIESMSTEEISAKYPVAGKRARTIQAGAKAALAIFDILRAKEIVISTFGLRHGTIAVEVIDGQLKISR